MEGAFAVSSELKAALLGAMTEIYLLLNYYFLLGTCLSRRQEEEENLVSDLHITHSWLSDGMNTDWRRIPWKTFLSAPFPSGRFTRSLWCFNAVSRRYLWDCEGTGLNSCSSSFWLHWQWVQAPKIILFLGWCLIFTFLIILALNLQVSNKTEAISRF